VGVVCDNAPMRDGISIEVSAADRERLAVEVTYRNSPQKQVWWAWLILATAEGSSTLEIMRRTRDFEALCVALARAVHARRRRGPAVRQDQRAQPAAVDAGALVDRMVELTLTKPPGEAELCPGWCG
jgi:hypothetical protein